MNNTSNKLYIMNKLEKENSESIEKEETKEGKDPLKNIEIKTNKRSLENKRSILVAGALVVVIFLSGCQLAAGDGLTVESERLIGVFITKEYLDLFDFDAYLEDNISDFVNEIGRASCRERV